MRAYISVLAKSFSTAGLLVGILFFAASLTPSLMPRSFLVQGALSGFCAALGYGVGVATVWLWRYLEIPVPRARAQKGRQMDCCHFVHRNSWHLPVEGCRMAKHSAEPHGAWAGRKR